MSYKDKEKQREANRERQRRYKESQKALLKGVTSEGVTEKALPDLAPGQYEGGIESLMPDDYEIEVDLDATIYPPDPAPKAKGFADLPKDVQENILRVSNMRIGNVEPDPVLVSEEIGRRTQVALHYQEFVRAG